MLTSITTTSGRCNRARLIACAPFDASPTISMSGSVRSRPASPWRKVMIISQNDSDFIGIRFLFCCNYRLGRLRCYERQLLSFGWRRSNDRYPRSLTRCRVDLQSASQVFEPLLNAEQYKSLRPVTGLKTNRVKSLPLILYSDLHAAVVPAKILNMSCVSARVFHYIEQDFPDGIEHEHTHIIALRLSRRAERNINLQSVLIQKISRKPLKRRPKTSVI